MKKLLLVVLVSMIFMVSCYNPGNHNPNNKSDDILILEIKFEEDEEYTWYKMGVNSNFKKYKTTWFKDSIGKYDIGEKLNK